MLLKGSRVAERRNQMGLSQEKLAELLEVSQNQISKYERGYSEATAANLVALARILDTTTDYLLGLTDDPHRPAPRLETLSQWQREMIYIMSEHDEDYQRRVVEIVKMVN